MKRTYEVAEQGDKRGLAEFLKRESQFLLPDGGAHGARDRRGDHSNGAGDARGGAGDERRGGGGAEAGGQGAPGGRGGVVTDGRAVRSTCRTGRCGWSGRG